jgi:hypothetical protein
MLGTTLDTGTDTDASLATLTAGTWTDGTIDFFGAIRGLLIFGTDDTADSCMEGGGITAGISLVFLISATCSSIIGTDAAMIGAAIGSSIAGATATGSALTTDDAFKTGATAIGSSSADDIAIGAAFKTGATATGSSATGADITTGSEGSEGADGTEATEGRAGANGSLYTFVFEFDESVDSVDILFIVSYFIFFINPSLQKGKGLSIVLFYDI